MQKIRLITIKLNDGTLDQGPAVDPDCSLLGACCCGFCKGEHQCQFGDCHNRLPDPARFVVGTLCILCSGRPWRVALPGHRASTGR